MSTFLYNPDRKGKQELIEELKCRRNRIVDFNTDG